MIYLLLLSQLVISAKQYRSKTYHDCVFSDFCTVPKREFSIGLLIFSLGDIIRAGNIIRAGAQEMSYKIYYPSENLFTTSSIMKCLWSFLHNT